MNHESGIKNKSSGFTLIELVVVFSIIGILSVLGIAGFNEYNQVQTLQTATNDVATMLNLAKSRALSQVKLNSICIPTRPLRGYRVLLLGTNIYRLRIHCGGSVRTILEKRLPRNITFGAAGTFFFPVLKGGVTTSGQVVLSGYGQTRCIAVSEVGMIASC